MPADTFVDAVTVLAVHNFGLPESDALDVRALPASEDWKTGVAFGLDVSPPSGGLATPPERELVVSTTGTARTRSFVECRNRTPRSLVKRRVQSST